MLHYNITLFCRVQVAVLKKIHFDKDTAKPSRISIPWIHVPMASELEVALTGQPVSHFLTPPAQQASRCSLVKLGPSRVALSTLNKTTQSLPMFCSFLFLTIFFYFSSPNCFLSPPKYQKARGIPKATIIMSADSVRPEFPPNASPKML